MLVSSPLVGEANSLAGSRRGAFPSPLLLALGRDDVIFWHCVCDFFIFLF